MHLKPAKYTPAAASSTATESNTSTVELEAAARRWLGATTPLTSSTTPAAAAAAAAPGFSANYYEDSLANNNNHHLTRLSNANYGTAQFTANLSSTTGGGQFEFEPIGNQKYSKNEQQASSVATNEGLLLTQNYLPTLPKSAFESRYFSGSSSNADSGGQQQQQQQHPPPLATILNCAHSTRITKFGRLKLMELSIIGLVEQSAQLANFNKQFPEALVKAKEALDALNSLRVLMMTQQQQQQQQEQAGGELLNKTTSGSSSNKFNATLGDATTKKGEQLNHRTTTTNQQQRIVSQPMTTGISLFELTLMVNSNLACQLKNSKQLEESVELYTQLCKLASGSAPSTTSGGGTAGGIIMGNSSNSNNNSNSNNRLLLASCANSLAAAVGGGGGTGLSGSGSSVTSSQVAVAGSQQQHEARFLLYRFGLEIGNALFELCDYQRALKYYRLTLDRLSSSTGLKNLKMKLMNNISITLLAMSEHRATATATSTANVNKHLLQPADAITSLNLLLADNLSQVVTNSNSATQSAQQQQQQQQQQQLDVCNSNHHRFGLNLIVCHHQRSDLTSMMSTLKSLVRVDICHQYKRVFDFNSLTLSAFDDDQEQWENAKIRQVNEVHATATATAGGSTTGQIKSGCGAAYTKRVPVGGGSFGLGAATRDISHLEAARRDSVGSSSSTLQTGQSNGELYLEQEQEQVKVKVKEMRMEREDDDRLTGALGDGADRETMTHTIADNDNSTRSRSKSKSKSKSGRSCLTSSLWPSTLTAADKWRQVMNCAQEDGLEILIGKKHGQIWRSLLMACNLMLELDNNRTRLISSSSSTSSVFDFCLKLLTSSDSYKSLVCDLRTNNVSEMLEKQFKLDEAISVLKGIDLAAEQQPSSMTTHNIVCLSDGAGNQLTSSSSSSSSSEKISTKSSLTSSQVTTNSCLIQLLQGNTNRALYLAEHAIRLDKFNWCAWINLANCHFELKNLQQAQLGYLKALAIDSNIWEANYNLALVNRKLGRQFSELKSSVKNNLLRETKRQILSTLLYRKMILSALQLAFIYTFEATTQSREFGDKDNNAQKVQQQQQQQLKQAMAIFNEFLVASSNSKKQQTSPEIHLTASKLIATIAATYNDNNNDSSQQQQAINLLQQANREYPFYLPVVERLIALNISNFNYEAAKLLLLSCVKNRPDQVKWYQMLAECHRRAAEYNEAIGVYKFVIDKFPRDTNCLKALIKLTEELGLIGEKQFFELKLNRIIMSRDRSVENS